MVNADERGNINSISCPPKPVIDLEPECFSPGGCGGMGGGGGGDSCNPASVGKRFSFNFPSGKKWTLSKADDARARAFYCGGGGGTESLPMQDAKMIVYSIGIRQDGNGEQIYKMCALRSRLRPLPSGGYMMSHGDYEDIVADSAEEIIRVVNAERPASNQLPYNLPITDLTYGECGGGGTGRVLCNDGTYQYETRGFVGPCDGHGGYPDAITNPPTGGVDWGYKYPAMYNTETNKYFCNPDQTLIGQDCYSKTRAR